jgi:hypothetical protein
MQCHGLRPKRLQTCHGSFTPRYFFNSTLRNHYMGWRAKLLGKKRKTRQITVSSLLFQATGKPSTLRGS